MKSYHDLGENLRVDFEYSIVDLQVFVAGDSNAVAFEPSFAVTTPTIFKSVAFLYIITKFFK